MNRPVAVAIAAAVAIVTLVFLWQHRDIVVLSRSAVSLAADPAFPDVARRVMQRERLTRRVLERIVDAANRRGERELALEALQRVAKAAPDERDVRLRLADALRSLGRFAEAEAIYKAIAGSGGGAPR
jgi:tetratricopeptide (TPR) repeat protein